MSLSHALGFRVSSNDDTNFDANALEEYAKLVQSATVVTGFLVMTVLWLNKKLEPYLQHTTKLLVYNTVNFILDTLITIVSCLYLVYPEKLTPLFLNAQCVVLGYSVYKSIVFLGLFADPETTTLFELVRCTVQAGIPFTAGISTLTQSVALYYALRYVDVFLFLQFICQVDEDFFKNTSSKTEATKKILDILYIISFFSSKCILLSTWGPKSTNILRVIYFSALTAF